MFLVFIKRKGKTLNSVSMCILLIFSGISLTIYCKRVFIRKYCGWVETEVRAGLVTYGEEQQKTCTQPDTCPWWTLMHYTAYSPNTLLRWGGGGPCCLLYIPPQATLNQISLWFAYMYIYIHINRLGVYMYSHWDACLLNVLVMELCVKQCQPSTLPLLYWLSKEQHNI